MVASYIFHRRSYAAVNVKKWTNKVETFEFSSFFPMPDLTSSLMAGGER